MCSPNKKKDWHKKYQPYFGAWSSLKIPLTACTRVSQQAEIAASAVTGRGFFPLAVTWLQAESHARFQLKLVDISNYRGMSFYNIRPWDRTVLLRLQTVFFPCVKDLTSEGAQKAPGPLLLRPLSTAKTPPQPFKRTRGISSGERCPEEAEFLWASLTSRSSEPGNQNLRAKAGPSSATSMAEVWSSTPSGIARGF